MKKEGYDYGYKIRNVLILSFDFGENSASFKTIFSTCRRKWITS